jgi:hypothetical protein
VFAMQDEIAESVAASLRGGAVSPREKRALHRAHTRTGAYELYLRGRQHLHRIRHVDLNSAADCSAGPLSSIPDMVRPTPASPRRIRRCTSGSAPTTRTSPEQSGRVSGRSSWRRISQRPTSRVGAP